MKRIALCVPNNHPSFDKKFIVSLIGAIRSFDNWNAKHEFKYELVLLFQNEGWIDTMREHLVLAAKEQKADYLLWVDTDMMFPQGMIERMVHHFENDQELQAVTGLYTWKIPPFMPHVYTRLNKETGKFKVAGAFPLRNHFEVEAAGYGCLMIKAEVYKDDMRPWFVMEKDGDKITYGEDLYFFKKFHPVKMICDPVISCKHLTENVIDVSSYVGYNNNRIKIEDNNIVEISEGLLKEISDEHKNRM